MCIEPPRARWAPGSMILPGPLSPFLVLWEPMLTAIYLPKILFPKISQTSQKAGPRGSYSCYPPPPPLATDTTPIELIINMYYVIIPTLQYQNIWVFV